MKAEKNRHTVWLTDEAWNKVKSHYQGDNCSTQNEYIEKAIRFYSGYLDAEQADSYLPRVLSGVLEGKLNALGHRIGQLLLKLSVDDAVMCNLIAASIEVDLDTLKNFESDVSKKLKAQTARLISRVRSNSNRGLTDAGADSKERLHQERRQWRGELHELHRYS